MKLGLFFIKFGPGPIRYDAFEKVDTGTLKDLLHVIVQVADALHGFGLSFVYYRCITVLVCCRRYGMFTVYQRSL